MTDLLTLTEASERLRISRTTMFSFIKTGYIPAEMVIRLGGRIMFDTADVESFLMNQRQAEVA